jgi:hypothetical protein
MVHNGGGEWRGMEVQEEKERCWKRFAKHYFRVWGLRLRVWGLGLRVRSSGFKEIFEAQDRQEERRRGNERKIGEIAWDAPVLHSTRDGMEEWRSHLAGQSPGSVMTGTPWVSASAALWLFDETSMVSSAISATSRGTRRPPAKKTTIFQLL